MILRATVPSGRRHHRIGTTGFLRLEAHGIHAEPAVFGEDLVDEASSS
jgi:hypothetical protein